MILRPLSPSLRSCSSDGITWVINCMMIDAEIYGITPSAKIDIRDKAPPPNMLSMPRMPSLCCANSCAITRGSTPGIVICDPIRKISIANSTNSRRERSSAEPVNPLNAAFLSPAAILLILNTWYSNLSQNCGYKRL